MSNRVSSQNGIPASSTNRVSSQNDIPVSSANSVSSQNVIPSSSSNGVSSQPTTHKHQMIKSIRLKVQDVHNLENGSRLLAGFLGQLATNPRYFSIGFESWASMPKTFVDRAFNDFSRFFFTSDQQKVKSWINNLLNKKWKEFMLKLWHEAEDPLLSKEDIIRNAPEGIPMYQWALYVNYHSKEETKKKQGKEVDRDKVWTETHKRKYESYVNDEARKIGVSIDHYFLLSSFTFLLNFFEWCEQAQFHLGVIDLDLALLNDKPAAITNSSSADKKSFHKAWERSNRLSLMFM
uniref:Uncharacterized protein n=1 Tax=Nicotiana tabacum TaxID=4097 RepID=A0A1S4DMJ5_TOBAC|nr:PREDICTED: uncharacterized protein LOC107831390 [Nicotiana tabacum]